MKNYKFYCNALNINEKKNQIILFIKLGIVLLISILVMSLSNVLIGLTVLFFILPTYLLHMNQIEKRYQNLITTKEIAFYGFYRYLINMLENNMIIYSALKESINLIDDILKPDVQLLIENIENDSSIQPFLAFANQFNNEQIKQMILILYQSQENGKNLKLLENLGNTLVKIQDDAIQVYIAQEVKKIERYSFFPLILSAITIILFSIFIFQSIGVDALV